MLFAFEDGLRSHYSGAADPRFASKEVLQELVNLLPGDLAGRIFDCTHRRFLLFAMSKHASPCSISRRIASGLDGKSDCR